MKTTLLVIIVTAMAAGLWQGRELSQLKARETVLRPKAGSAADSSTGGSKGNRDLSPLEARKAAKRGALAKASASITPSAQASSSSKATRKGDRDRFDASAFVEILRGLVTRPPTDEEKGRMQETIASASPRDLKELVEQLRHSGLPEDLIKVMFIPIAPRLAESDPKYAAGLALEGGEGKSFRTVMRTWLSEDPQAAAAWMKEAEASDPPLNEARFRELDDLDLDALSVAARLAADPAGDGLNDLLDLKDQPLQSAMGEIVAALPPHDLVQVISRISKQAAIPERGRLDLIGSTLARHHDPVMARQVLLDAALPPEQFREAATTMIVSLDPTGIRSGAEWFRTSTSGETKAEGLRGIVATWSQQDPKAALEWAEGLSDPAERADILSVIPEKQER